MGWRSWYASAGHGLEKVTKDFVTISMDAMADRSRTVDGVPTSLIDLGYTRASVDDGYMAYVPDLKQLHCHSNCVGVNVSFHDAKGWLVLNRTAFPDIKAMVAHAHGLNLTAGWYTNNYEGTGCEGGWSKTPELEALHMNGEAQWKGADGF